MLGVEHRFGHLPFEALQIVQGFAAGEDGQGLAGRPVLVGVGYL